MNKITQKELLEHSDEVIKRMGMYLKEDEYKIMLEIIDEYIIYVLKMDREDLPWLNKEKFKGKHSPFLGMLRLIIARYISEDHKLKSKSLNH
jgi:hypothetical protein